MALEEVKKASVEAILNTNLTIPDFQRPYCWDGYNVSQLLNDIFDNWKNNKESYRIGSVILYKSKNEYQIIDGQQRITTILLILRNLDINYIGKKLFKNQLKYDNIESKKNIFNNNTLIRDWIKTLSDNKSFYKYLSKNCEFTKIVVSDLSEAFQMFDSQNGRGKELEAYNLLKAYHIHAMEYEKEEIKKLCDKRWENSAMYKKNPADDEEEKIDLLKQVINEQLYRTRIWSRREIASEFDKTNIDEFKGITINENTAVKFPFINSYLIDYFISNYCRSVSLIKLNTKPRFSNGDPENINPFVQVNQKIINGKKYFEYIETYVEIYKKLFIEFSINNDKLINFKNFYLRYCQNYKGAERTGDTYLKEVYKSLILLLFDKYGENGVLEYYKTMYILVYQLRLENKQVKYKTVAKHPLEYFAEIEKSKELNNLYLLKQKTKELQILCRKEDVDEVKIAFINYGFKKKKGDEGLFLSFD